MSSANSAPVKKAIELLMQAKIAQKVYYIELIDKQIF